MYKIFFIKITLLLSLNLAAGIAPEIIIEGRIINFNNETVELFRDGKITKVLRKNIPKHYKIVTGNDVHAVLSSKEILKKIKKEKMKVLSNKKK